MIGVMKPLLPLDSHRSEDRDLVTEILSGARGEEPYRELLGKYWRLLVAWVRPRVTDTAEAEDVAQEAFIRAFRALPRLEDPNRFLRWLARIALNLAADTRRRRPRCRSLESLLEDGSSEIALPAPPDDPGEGMDRREDHRLVLAAVDRLPGKYRLVVLLRYFEGLSGREIAGVLGEPEGTVRNRLFRAHDRLRKLLGNRAWAPLLPLDGEERRQ
jgi:RNA polymerase sigma-70 factor, ECF subfamily